MISLSQKGIREFQKKILHFYKLNKRDLPWRKTTNPYHILLSEFMLQQTQVSRVIVYYQDWLERWPAIQDLSQALFNEVLSKWIGLGYNRRARYLHKTAKIIVQSYNGDVLLAMKFYKNLPGIGLYTAQAVRIFAGNENIATVDTNIRRILLHEFGLDEKISNMELYTIAHQCIPKGKSCIWHNALMDYGAMYLTVKKTGIKPITKQPRFEGSDRQIRGHILKLLVKEPCFKDSLYKSISVECNRFNSILKKMEQEKLIKTEKDVIFINPD